MNANRNLVINFFVTKVKDHKVVSTHHDHWVGKEKHTQPHLKNNEAHSHRATKKRYVYKKKGTGGYGK